MAPLEGWAPDWPAVSETLAGFDFPSWVGLVGPAGMPRELVDKLNAAVAQALHDNVRQEDVVGRMGGEEFAVLLWNTRLAEAVRVAEQLRTRAAAVSVPDEAGGSIGCSISLGVAEVSSPGEALDRVLARADLAMYTAKAAGRNRVFPEPEA